MVGLSPRVVTSGGVDVHVDTCVFVGGVDVRPAVSGLDAGDVGGEEMDSMPVEVAASAVIVLGGPGVGMAGEDLGVAERNTGVEGVGNGRVTQRVRADVTRDPGSLRDTGDHPVRVAPVDRPARRGAQDQRTGGPLAAARLQDAEDRDSQRHGCRQHLARRTTRGHAVLAADTAGHSKP